MTQDPRTYTSGFNPDVIKDIKHLNEKIEKEQDAEEIMKLRMQRLCRGMEINSGYNRRPWAGYYPY